MWLQCGESLHHLNLINPVIIIQRLTLNKTTYLQERHANTKNFRNIFIIRII